MLCRPSRSTKHNKINQTKYNHSLPAFSANQASQDKPNLMFAIKKHAILCSWNDGACLQCKRRHGAAKEKLMSDGASKLPPLLQCAMPQLIVQGKISEHDGLATFD